MLRVCVCVCVKILFQCIIPGRKYSARDTVDVEIVLSLLSPPDVPNTPPSMDKKTMDHGDRF